MMALRWILIGFALAVVPAAWVAHLHGLLAASLTFWLGGNCLALLAAFGWDALDGARRARARKNEIEGEASQAAEPRLSVLWGQEKGAA